MPKPASAITHDELHGYTFDQRPSGVLVTAPDGGTELVLNARIGRDPLQQILLESARPARHSRITAETAKRRV